MKLSGLSEQETHELVPLGTILVGYRGSLAHGTHIPPDADLGTDDRDIMGVVIAPEACYLGIDDWHSRGTFEKWVKDYDGVFYELRKYVDLLMKANPNVLSLLWLEPNHYLLLDEHGKRLIAARSLFATKQAYHSFIGYAHGQLKRMEAFGRGSHQGRGFMGAKRKELVERFGYDTKNAQHLIRLLRMGIEFLSEGYMHVQRQDAEELKAIKRGEWSLERVKAEADRLFKRSEDAYDRSLLPARPDRDAVNNLVVGILRDAISA